MGINDKIKYLNFNQDNNSDILDVLNELAELEQRKPHDTARRLILEAGKQRIAELKAACQAQTSSQ